MNHTEWIEQARAWQAGRSDLSAAEIIHDAIELLDTTDTIGNRARLAAAEAAEIICEAYPTQRPALTALAIAMLQAVLDYDDEPADVILRTAIDMHQENQ